MSKSPGDNESSVVVLVDGRCGEQVVLNERCRSDRMMLEWARAVATAS
jgi:hypothetical protein